MMMRKRQERGRPAAVGGRPARSGPCAQSSPGPQRLRKRSDFVRVQQGGKRFSSRHLVLLLAQGETPERRFGLTVSRKVGNAVTRNRVRRRLREILRTSPALLCEGYDHVVIALPRAARAEFATLGEELTCLLTQARAWASSRSSCSH